MLKKIEALNKNIDSLMKEKAKSEAQKEVWENSLIEEIKKYKNNYGVDLSDKSFAGIKKKLSAEIEKVEEQTAKEFEQAQKLVSLIQSGDIEGAWKELGVDINPKTEEAEEEVSQEGLQGVVDAVEDIEGSGLSDEDFFGTGLDDDEESEVLEDGDFVVDEDGDEEEDTSFKGFNGVEKKSEADKGGVKPLFGGFVFEDDEEEDDFVTPEYKQKGTKTKEEPKKTNSFVLDDDEEDDDPFSGFGGVLAGSKFQPKR